MHASKFAKMTMCLDGNHGADGGEEKEIDFSVMKMSEGGGSRPIVGSPFVGFRCQGYLESGYYLSNS